MSDQSRLHVLEGRDNRDDEIVTGNDFAKSQGDLWSWRWDDFTLAWTELWVAMPCSLDPQTFMVSFL